MLKRKRSLEKEQSEAKAEEKTSHNLLRLPLAMLRLVISALSTRERALLSTVSSEFKAIINDDFCWKKSTETQFQQAYYFARLKKNTEGFKQVFYNMYLSSIIFGDKVCA